MTVESTTKPTLVIGSSGKTGSRVARRLAEKGRPVRSGTRSATPGFDWEDKGTWRAALEGVGAVYISFHSDLAFPGAPASVRSLIETGLACGAERFVLIATRGEDEARRVDQAIPAHARNAVTVLQCAWFMQNFSEGFLTDTVHAGELAFPGGAAIEPWVDVDDIADVATVALTEDGHGGQPYQLTSPTPYTLTDVASVLSRATGRAIRYTEVPPDAYQAAAEEQGVPAEFVELIGPCGQSGSGSR